MDRLGVVIWELIPPPNVIIVEINNRFNLNQTKHWFTSDLFEKVINKHGGSHEK